MKSTVRVLGLVASARRGTRLATSRRLSQGLLAVLAFLLAGSLFAGPAAAHDRLIKSTPKKKAELEKLTEIKLTFSAGVKLPRLVLEGGRLGAPETDDTVVTAQVEEPLDPGEYTLAYRVVSSDGHPIKGEIPFTVTGSAESPGPTESPESTQIPMNEVEKPVEPASVLPWIWAAAGLLAGAGIGIAFVIRKNKGAP